MAKLPTPRMGLVPLKRFRMNWQQRRVGIFQQWLWHRRAWAEFSTWMPSPGVCWGPAAQVTSPWEVGWLLEQAVPPQVLPRVKRHHDFPLSASARKRHFQTAVRFFPPFSQHSWTTDNNNLFPLCACSALFHCLNKKEKSTKMKHVYPPGGS